MLKKTLIPKNKTEDNDDIPYDLIYETRLQIPTREEALNCKTNTQSKIFYTKWYDIGTCCSYFFNAIKFSI